MKLEIRTTKTLVFAFIAAYLVATSASDDAFARKHHEDYQNSAAVYNQTSMEIFPIKRGYDGAQFIVTKEGYLVSLPGLGIAPDATQIAAYKDGQNNIWYIDRNGTPIKLTPDEVEWGRAQINQQAQQRANSNGQADAVAPQNSMFASSQMQSPSKVAVQQPAPTVIVQQPNNRGSGVGALATGLAAAGGAFAGAALGSSMYSNNYYGIPYGQPIYRNGRRYYYNGSNGSRVYINNTNNKYINQWNKQTNWQNENHNHPQNWQKNNNNRRQKQVRANGGSRQVRTTSNNQASRPSSRSTLGSSGRSGGGASRSGKRR